MRLFNQQRYDADLIRALQTENEALSKRNAELERALARIEAIAAPPRLALQPGPRPPGIPRQRTPDARRRYHPLKSRTDYNPATGLIAREYWVRDEEKE